MSFFEDASLVLIPSGIKNAKVYSVKPTDGTGDLTFSRASSATRVQSDGLIEKVRTNLVLQSNTFSNASWTKTDSTVTGGQSGYDGTTNAWLLSKSAANGRASQSVNTSDLKTFSLYAKAGTNNWVAITFTQAESFSYFDLSNGTLGGSVGTDIVARTITSVGNGWYRISISVNNTSTNVNIYVADSNGSVAGTSGNILIQAAQIGAGDIATDYIATTTAAVSVGPVSGLPRLDYLGSTCPRLLLEPQRTNVATYSEQFDNAAWSKTKATVTANDTISPDGYTNADKIVFADGTSTINQAYNLAGATATRSVYIKGTAGQTISLDDVFASQPLITLTGQWQRITFTAAAPNGYGFGISTFGGATARTIWLWGAQTEVGAYATSYIPTLGTSVTRVADAASKTGISSLIGQTEGTLYWEVSNITQYGGNGSRFFTYTDSNNFILINPYGTNLRILVVSSGTAFDNNITISGDAFKIAVAYKANDYKFYVNGVSVGTPAVTSVPAMSAIGIVDDTTAAATTSQSKTSQMLLFKTRLTNAQLAELTA
jgi:hypothetical protein